MYAAIHRNLKNFGKLSSPKNKTRSWVGSSFSVASGGLPRETGKRKPRIETKAIDVRYLVNGFYFPSAQMLSELVRAAGVFHRRRRSRQSLSAVSEFFTAADNCRSRGQEKWSTNIAEKLVECAEIVAKDRQGP